MGQLAEDTARGTLQMRLSLIQKMAVKLGDIVPNFSAATTHGKIDFHTWVEGSWAILFSHPADYTPVCTTELGRAQAFSGEFAKRGVKMIALSCDSVEDHQGWISDIKAYNGLTDFSYPIIADPRRKVATPADWRQGGSVIVAPSVKPEDAPGLFPKGVKQHEVPSGKGYMRTTPMPE